MKLGILLFQSLQRLAYKKLKNIDLISVLLPSHRWFPPVGSFIVGSFEEQMLLKIPYIHCGSIGYRILLAIAVGAFTVFATSSYQLYNIYQHNNAAATVMCKANATVDLSLFPTQQLIVHINCNGTEFQEVYKCSSYSDFICAEIPTFDIPCKYDTQTNLYYNKKLSENDTMFFFMMSAFITIGSVFAMCMEWQSAYSWTTYEIRYLAILFNWQKNVD